MSARWYFARNKQKVGPFSAAQIKQMADCGILQPEEHVWFEGAAKWVEARKIPGLFTAHEDSKYWLTVGGKTRGPYVAEQIQAGLTTRQFNLDTQVWLEHDKKWVPLAQMTQFREFAPGSLSHSQAQLLARSLDLEEARLHLAGKEGDETAQLLSLLLDLKRAHENKPELVASLDRSIALLKVKREQGKAAPAQVLERPAAPGK
jgi:hypothetical protein